MLCCIRPRPKSPAAGRQAADDAARAVREASPEGERATAETAPLAASAVTFATVAATNSSSTPTVATLRAPDDSSGEPDDGHSSSRLSALLLKLPENAPRVRPAPGPCPCCNGLEWTTVSPQCLYLRQTATAWWVFRRPARGSADANVPPPQCRPPAVLRPLQPAEQPHARQLARPSQRRDGAAGAAAVPAAGHVRRNGPWLAGLLLRWQPPGLTPAPAVPAPDRPAAFSAATLPYRCALATCAAAWRHAHCVPAHIRCPVALTCHTCSWPRGLCKCHAVVNP
jgi:hypothetical protein